MSVKLKYKVNDYSAKLALTEISKESAEALPRIVLRVAYWTFGELIRRTPKKWTGQTRKGWQITGSGADISVLNESKVMRYLEEGTRAHGPVRAKYLFIPLTRRAALGTGKQRLIFGKDYVLAKWVRGIKAMKIVETQRGRTQERLMKEVKAFIKAMLERRGGNGGVT